MIRPLGLGEIVDRAVALTLRHFRPLFLWMLLVQAPAIVVSRLQLAELGELAASLGNPEGALVALKAVARTSLGVLAVVVVLQSAATALCAAVVAPSLTAGAEVPPPALRRVLAITSAALASLLVFLLAPTLGALPGLLVLARATSTAAWATGMALLVAGAGFGLLVAVLRTLLVPAVAAIEGRPHFAAIARSIALMRAPRGLPFVQRPALRASLVLFATFVIALAINVVVGIPRGVAGRLAGGSALLPASLPLWAEIPLVLFEAVASAALQPFSLVAVVVLYFDRRARREGLDLEAFADEVEAGAPP